MTYRLKLFCGLLFMCLVGCKSVSDRSGGTSLQASDDSSRFQMQVQLKDVHTGRKIATDFSGMSIEYGIESFFNERSLPQAMFVNLLKNLKHGVLRVGGASQENNCWQSSNPKCTKAISEETLKKIFAVAQKSGWSLLMGTSLAINDPQNAVAYTKVLKKMATDYGVELNAVEIGNEPDWAYLYVKGMRDPGYTLADHARETAAYIAALKNDPETKDVRLTGPAVTYKWVDRIGEWIDALGPMKSGLSYVTEHMYHVVPCRACDPNSIVPCAGCTEKCELCELDPKNPISAQKEITYRDLLDRKRTEKVVGDIKPYVVQARARNMPFRMAEMNSVNSCGLFGISDNMASALWTLDIMFRFADLGMTGVNLHNSNGCPYNYIVADINSNSPKVNVNHRNRPPARSPYYGMLMFGQALGDFIVDVSVNQVSPVADAVNRSNVQVYATTPCGTCEYKVFIINKDLKASGVVDIAVPYQSATAEVLVLQGRSLESKESEITYGGGTVDRATGELRRVQPQKITAAAGNVYSVEVPFASAVMVKFPRS